MMTDMANSSEFKVAGKDITVFEMDMKQIRQWLSDVESDHEVDDKQSFINDMLFDDFSVSDLTRMSSITEEALNELVPSAIAHLADICKEKNQFFFGIVGKRRKLVDRSLGLLESS